MNSITDLQTVLRASESAGVPNSVDLIKDTKLVNRQFVKNQAAYYSINCFFTIYLISIFFYKTLIVKASFLLIWDKRSNIICFITGTRN